MLCVFFCYFHACFEFRKKVCLRREKKKRKKNKVLLTCCFCSHARFDDLSAAFIQIIAALLVAVLSAKSHIVGKDTPNNTGYWHTWCRRHAERFMNIVAFSIRYVCLFVWSERNLIVSLYIILLERDDCQFRVVKMKRNHLNNWTCSCGTIKEGGGGDGGVRAIGSFNLVACFMSQKII